MPSESVKLRTDCLRRGGFRFCPLVSRRLVSAILNRLLVSGVRAMPENRARKHHQDRVAETLRLEIGTMIDGELSGPRIGNCYVSEVSLNPGGKSARVYVALDSHVKDIVQAEKDTIAGLEAAKRSEE